MALTLASTSTTNPDLRFLHQVELARFVVEDEFGVLRGAVCAGFDRLEHFGQAVGVEHHLHAVLRPLHAQHVGEHLHIVHERTGVCRAGIRHGQRKRLAQDLTRHIRLRAHVDDLRLNLLDHERHLAVAEGLELRAEVDQRGVDLQLAPDLARRGDHVRPFEAQAGLKDRLVDLQTDLPQILIGHPLVEEDDRLDVHPVGARPHLTGQRLEQPSASSQPIG
jgi:hypothetical protein